MDLSKLSPSDAVVTLRSLPRRFRAVLTPAEPDDADAGVDPDDLAHRAGADGWSAIDHLVHVTRAIADATAALRAVLVRDDAAVDAAVIDDTSDGRGAGRTTTLDAAFEGLADAAEAMAEPIGRTDSHQWRRTARVAGSDRTVTALDVVRAAVATGVSHLRAAEQVVDEVRGRQ